MGFKDYLESKNKPVGFAEYKKQLQINSDNVQSRYNKWVEDVSNYSQTSNKLFDGSGKSKAETDLAKAEINRIKREGERLSSFLKSVNPESANVIKNQMDLLEASKKDLDTISTDEYRLTTKYKDYTYKQLDDFLKSESYTVQRRRGIIGEEEANWLKNQLYSLATSAELEERLKNKKKLFAGNQDNFDASVPLDKNKIFDTEGLKNTLKSVKVKNEEWAKSNGYKDYNEYLREYENLEGEIEVLNTVIAQKKKQEAFDKKWSSEFNAFKQGETNPTAEQTRIFEGAVKLIEEDEYLKYLTDDEKAFAASLTSNQSANKALDYYKDLIALRLDSQYNQALMQDLYDFSSQNALTGVLGSLASIPVSLASGIEQAGTMLSGQTYKRNRSSTVAQGFREGTKSQWDSEFWDFIYDTTMSGADSFAAAGLSAVVPGLGEVLLGGSAAASAYNDALDRGVSSGQALLSSLAAGAAESLFEHISIGKLLDAKDITKGFTKAGLKEASKEIAKQVFVNASEETLTEISNILTDQLINQDLSSYAIAVKDYYMQGMSPEEAKKKAAEDLGKQVLLAGASGALMGFAFGAGGSVKGLSSSQYKNSHNGDLIKSNGNVAELKTVAEQYGTTEIKSAAEKLTDNSKPSEIGYVYNSLVESAAEKAIKQMTPALLESGATESGSNAAKSWAMQIVNSVLTPKQNKTNQGRIATLMTNAVTKGVYAEFTNEGKYGGDVIATLAEMGESTMPKAKTKADLAETATAEQGAAPMGPVAEAYGQRVAENLEKERPNKKAFIKQVKAMMPKDSRLTPEGEKAIRDFAKANGLKVKFTDGLVDGIGNGKFKNGVLYISRRSISATNVVIKHEFTHSLEQSKLYAKMQEYVFEESEAFKKWVEEKGFRSLAQMERHEIDKYEQNGIKYDAPAIKAKADIFANFVSETLFTEDGSDINGNVTKEFLTELSQKNRNLFERFVDFIKNFFKQMVTRGAAEKDVMKLEQKFLRLVEDARKQRAKGEQGKPEQGKYSLPDVDNYTEKQYNNFGWVRANDVLTAAEYLDLHSNYTGHKHTKDNYPITRFGETVVHSAQYTDILMYVKGPINNPQITKVVRIDHNESWAIPFIMEEILNNERKQDYQPFKTIEDYFGQGILNISKARDYASYREYRAELERNSGAKSDATSGTEQDGKGSTQQNTETSRADSIDGSVFSLPDIPAIAEGKSYDELSELVEEGKITSDEAFAALADRFGEMPKGEKPKVDVTVPAKISDTENVSRFVRTALESGHLDAGMTETEKRNIINGARSYKPISDKAALGRAENKIKADAEGAVREWENLIDSGKRLTKFDIALGEQLLVQASESGNANDVVRYMAELAELGTEMGQATQALRLLKQMTGIGRLYYVTRAVARLNKDIEAQYGDKHKIVEIDPDLANILANSKNQAEIDAVVEDLIKDVASQVKSSWVDKFNAWRYLAMLGNPRTHVRNFVGNTLFAPVIGIKNKIAFVAEQIFIDKENRSKIFGPIKSEYRDFAQKDFLKVQDIVKGGGKMSPSDQIREQMKIFNNKYLEKARKFNFDMLEKSDLKFLKGHYVRALGAAMQARGLDVNNISAETLGELRDYAINEAQKATFRDASHFAQTLNKLAHPGKDASLMSKAAGVAVEGLLPFKKTPINILKRGIEYSPVGIATSIAEGLVSLKKGEFSAAQFIDSLSAGLTGTGIMLLGAFLSSLGIITGGLDYEDEDALERLAGAQPYAINIGNYSYTIDFAAPAVLPFMIGAETAKFFNNESVNEALGFFDAIAAMGAPMTELSMLQGLNDAIETIAYSDNKMGDFATNIFASYFSQYIPTIGGQIARTFDSTRRTNFVDKNSPVPKIIQTTYQKALGKVPYFENKKVPYIDAWGRTEENDNILLRAFENFVSPGYVSKIEDDKVNEELARIYTQTSEGGVVPKRASTSFQVDGQTVNLDADKYVKYATDKGQYSRQYLEELMSNSMYSSMDDSEKASVVSDLYSYANAKAKTNVSDYDYRTSNTYKTAAKLEEVGISPVSYYIALAATSVENADTDGSESVSKSEKKKALRNAGFNSVEIDKILNVNKK